MVIELSGVQFRLKSYACVISKSDLNFNCHFIRSILKAQFNSQICQTMSFLSFIFLQYDWLV